MKEEEISRIMEDGMLVYEHLADEESRYLFEKRLMYSFTRDYNYIRDVVNKSVSHFRGGTRLLDALKQKNRTNYMFGAGYYGDFFLHTWPECCCAVVDNYASRERKFRDLPIIRPEEMDLASDSFVFLNVRELGKRKAVITQLLGLGVHEEQIIDVCDIWDDFSTVQYFDLPQLTHKNNEIIADVGCLGGRAIRTFKDWAGSAFSYAYGFEPMPENQQEIEKTLKEDIGEKFCLIGKAAGSYIGTQEFNRSGCMAATVYADIGSERFSLPVTTLDNELLGKGVTFLTMDIEGAELEALHGGRKLIAEEAPKLAICVYHKPEDILTIPIFLLSCRSDFKFYLRHYCIDSSETVLYAISE